MYVKRQINHMTGSHAQVCLLIEISLTRSLPLYKPATIMIYHGNIEGEDGGWRGGRRMEGGGGGGGR